MNTEPSTELSSASFVLAIDSFDEEFFIFNPTSSVMHIKFTDDSIAPPADKEGSILLLPYKGIQRGAIEGYPWICGADGTTASITE